MAKKTRMSGIIDRSTMGVNLGTEMEISKEAYLSLRKAFKKASNGELEGYKHLKFTIVGNDKIQGNTIVMLDFPKYGFIGDDKNINNIKYEFKKQGKNHFLNVTGNPTSIVAGRNDFPVLVIGGLYGEKNAPTVTFKYMNRVMYAILDKLFEQFGFKWEGADRKRLVEGDISIQSYQIAWYSGDLGEERDAILQYIRTVYGGMDMTLGRVITVAHELNLAAKIWPDNNNITIEHRSGANRMFSLTLYAKDKEPNTVEKNSNDKKRMAKLIRWDCTLNRQFLISKMNTVKLMEEVYEKACELNGYDIGFIRHISNKIEQKLKLPYMLSLHLDKYLEDLDNIKKNGSKAVLPIFNYWMDDGELFDFDDDAAVHFNISKQRYSQLKIEILKMGIDISFPRATHEAILENRILAQRTIKERRDELELGENGRIRWRELVSRDDKNLDGIRNTLRNAEGAITIRKMKPEKVKPENFWIYRGK